MTGHTKTPWLVFRDCGSCDWPGIDQKDGISIVHYGDIREDCGIRGKTREEAHANAAFIVRAVNAHETLVKAVTSIATWADAKCPCENEEPNPCPLCGASVENLERCKSAENVLPRTLLSDIREALALAKGET